MSTPDCPYVSRGGLKLEAGLRNFGVSVEGCVVADFGSHAGGFVDCLLQHGAKRVYAIEPGYGVLDYRLRRDARVVVCERKNALHFPCPESCDWVTIDVGWTPQRLILLAARNWLKPGASVITLVKPHYEAPPALLRDGVLPECEVDAVLSSVETKVASLNWVILRRCESPIRGHGGNAEWLWLLRPTELITNA